MIATYTSGERFWLEEQGDQIWFCHNFDTAGGWTGRRPTEMHLETRRLGGLNMNLTYSHLVEQVRFEQSLRLLHDPAVKLADIASELSNTDAANFTRGFKRWTGVSPTEFRHLRWKM